MSGEHEELPLSKAAEYLLGECRMVLPGIQALFGFQLIAVFNPTFRELEILDQRLHVLAIGLIAIAIALIMTPAAYHRQRGSHHITADFFGVSTRLLLWSMLPLALAICLDFYLILKSVLDGGASALLAGVLFVVFALFWFVLPRSEPFSRVVRRAEKGAQPGPIKGKATCRNR
ncbi:MAG TPA: DUF6328 family protein [Burkholderiales bacterium]|nr:DUF6328 family protein [Burkholderiales bacterium]